MSEACPMSQERRFYWEPDFPEVCRKVCGPLIDKALDEPYGAIDRFESDCEWDDIEYSGTSLQGNPGSPSRDVATASFCVEHNTEAFAEMRSFRCINPQN